MINQAQLLGRIGKIDTKTLSNEMKVCSMSLVTSKKYVKNGEKQEETTWHNVTCFGKIAEIAERWVQKGDLLWIQGEMKNQKYQAQDGTEKTKFYVLATELKLMPKAKEHKPEPKEHKPEPKAMQFKDEFDDSPIPF